MCLQDTPANAESRTNMANGIDFDMAFCALTDHGPFPWQRELYERLIKGDIPSSCDIPTGLGKTAVVAVWLIALAHGAEKLPRRLVYCLPMRTLVEQTERAARQWTDRLPQYDSRFRDNPISVHVLMGGVEKTDWDKHPERDAILIGTQDMLLSRALNRGYSMSRYRWPMHFALLNNDCLWVLDETQLMGVGLTTSAQLQGLRAKLDTFGPTHSLWMSATLDEGGLATVDHPPPEDGWNKLELTAADRALEAVRRVIEADKPCAQAKTVLTSETDKGGYARELAAEIVEAHRPGTLTLAVINRVDRAQRVLGGIEKLGENQGDRPEVMLIHSRFRPVERKPVQEQALHEGTIAADGPGRIVVATQAIEAGVDVSATTLFTELAPWPSLVQRFGRCNRRGVCGTDGHPEARVFWIDIDTSDAKKSNELALPYSADELNTARQFVLALSDVGPNSLEAVVHEQGRPIVHTIRRKDILELWDTTPDLAGNDLDVSRYIREADDTDVQVYWREWDLKEQKGSPPDPKDKSGRIVFPAPAREELCGVSTVQARKFVSRLKGHLAWRWNPLERSWQTVDSTEVCPGMVLLFHVDAGGYDETLGWTGDAKHKPTSKAPAVEEGVEEESMDDDALGKEPVLLIEHLQRVTRAAEHLQEEFQGPPEGVPWQAIVTAVRWHDVGKAHEAFQNAMRDFEPVKERDPDGTELWAKPGAKGIPNYRVIEIDNEGKPRVIKRRGFRHELASALAWLAHPEGDVDGDLVAFLIAAHHGKVRGSIRSLPNEKQPDDPDIKFARGLWEGDEIPPVDLGGGRATHKVTVDLSLMELGEDEQGRASWLARVLKLRDDYGPFRLAYLETLVRIADWHGSNEGGSSHVS